VTRSLNPVGLHLGSAGLFMRWDNAGMSKRYLRMIASGTFIPMLAISAMLIFTGDGPSKRTAAEFWIGSVVGVAIYFAVVRFAKASDLRP
jgi:hypothetical protein